MTINGIEFPKQIMTVSELVNLGFSEDSLLMYCNQKHSCAFKDGRAKNSPWKIPVKEYMNYLQIRRARYR